MIRFWLGIIALLATLYAFASFITALYTDFYVGAGIAIIALLAFLAVQRFTRKAGL